LLDNRPVRTPDKRILTIPADKPQLATAIALEWDLLMTSKQALKHHYIPLTSLAARAESILEMEQEGQTTTRNEIADLMLRYLDTDTTLCLAPESRDLRGSAAAGGKSLRELQLESTQSLIAFLTSRAWPGASIRPVTEDKGLVPASQPQVTKDIIRGWINSLPPYELVGLERATLAAKSLLIAARLVVEWSFTLSSPNHDGPQEYHRVFGAEEAAEAASLEVRFQTQQWGEVEDTHDVEKEDLTRQLASVVLLISGN
jgi:ATP synthase F1 complex assembly factor 2